MNEACDKQLLTQMQNGDENAFVTLYRRHHSEIYRFGLYMTGSQEIAEDITTEVFLDLIQASRRIIATEVSLRPLLFQHACDSVERYFTRRGGDAQNPASGGERSTPVCSTGPPDLAGESARIAEVRAAILKLPLLYREVVVLCEVQGKSTAEAAELLSCGISHIRSRLHHASGLMLGELAASRLKSLESQA